MIFCGLSGRSYGYRRIGIQIFIGKGADVLRIILRMSETIWQHRKEDHDDEYDSFHGIKSSHERTSRTEGNEHDPFLYNCTIQVLLYSCSSASWVRILETQSLAFKKGGVLAYNERIESRILNIISDWEGTDRKKMFGGVCFLFNGNMFSGVYKDHLILRLGEKGASEALRSPFASAFYVSGRPLKGWVMIDQRGFKDDDELSAYLLEARDFAKSLPRKK